MFRRPATIAATAQPETTPSCPAPDRLKASTAPDLPFKSCHALRMAIAERERQCRHPPSNVQPACAGFALAAPPYPVIAVNGDRRTLRPMRSAGGT